MTPRHTTPAPFVPWPTVGGADGPPSEQTAGVSGSVAGLKPRTETHRILEGCQQVNNAGRRHVGGVSGKSGESHMVCLILSPVTR